MDPRILRRAPSTNSGGPMLPSTCPPSSTSSDEAIKSTGSGLICGPSSRAHTPAVWRLCQCIALDVVNAAASLPAVKAASEAFGIGPYLNTRDRLQLYEFYRELLGTADRDVSIALPASSFLRSHFSPLNKQYR
ncbi:hypothetical protein DL764_001302 [Monosporascus ibericus]|uniref:Uncharacterized protein n=1 Tax=Monosporascus ibericus TaxID=155417 RepID=A0A4Q4TV51_9PEZI|nr:hypothetical protein DL764_001302 [Monosporascus ibericus]